MELWLPINENEKYSISTIGRVRNNKSGLILKNKPHKRDGYFYVCLSNNGEILTRKIHRLVAIHFCLNPNNYNIVDHKDRDRTNNNFDNLRWVDASINSINRVMKDHSTMIKGVSQRKDGLYEASLKKNNIRYRYFFHNLDDAINYRKELEVMYHNHIE